MVIIIPDEGAFEAFESALTADSYYALLAALTPQEMFLSMLKFMFKSQLTLGDILAGMGIPDAFQLAADFSGTDGQSAARKTALPEKTYNNSINRTHPPRPRQAI